MSPLAQTLMDLCDSVIQEIDNSPADENDKADVRRRVELFRSGVLALDTPRSLSDRIAALK
jgi:hypothetical protein